MGNKILMETKEQLLEHLREIFIEVTGVEYQSRMPVIEYFKIEDYFTFDSMVQLDVMKYSPILPLDSLEAFADRIWSMK